jgi:hypothetical protein
VILFDLRCAKEHVFEGWFRDSEAYEDEVRARRIACPVCSSRKVEKAPMAPRIGKGERAVEPAAEERTRRAAISLRELAELRRHVEANCDYVGERFAEEARRIHHGETERRDIYGEATAEESDALRGEGVKFARIPWVPRFDG